MNDKDTIKAMTEWAAREENKYREKYEETGSPATLKTCEHYEDIQDICALAMEERSEVDTKKATRKFNLQDAVMTIESRSLMHVKQLYTADEVVKIILELEKYF